jgi:2-methylcitrate dehydratase PrpD
VHGHTRPEAFAPDERVTKLAERVEVRAADDLENSWPDAAPARVTVRTHDRTLKKRVDNPHGHHSNPAAPNELRAKFELLVGGDAGCLYERLLDVEDVDDMAALFKGLA